jgi:hypothetical protein
MPQIRVGHLYAFFLFDVAETIDLAVVPGLVPAPTERARIAPKPPTPSYVQYDKPPLSFDGAAVGEPDVAGFGVRVRVFEYGVVSLRLSRPFSGDWIDLVQAGQALIENEDIERQAEQACRRLVERLQPALAGVHASPLSEDYVVFGVHELEQPMSASELRRDRGSEIALMLRGERQALSEEEQERILQHRLSYLSDDLIVPTWNAAFVYDTVAGAAAALEIMEFANSQLLEFRYYDQRLDSELAAIYGQLQRPRWWKWWAGGRYTRAARQGQALLIDVNELSDRSENALKFVGDVYAARLFGLVAERLGLGHWKANVRDKLQALDDINRFAVEQSSMSRGEFLEATIVLILVLELVLVFMGVMQ